MICQPNTFRLRLEGTAQKQRPPLAFRADYVRVDEHRTADWMVFARLYARYLKYYDEANVPDGDWTAFYTHNPAMVLANLSAARVDWYREEIRLIYIELQKLDLQADALLLRQHFNRLFDMVANLAMQLDEHFKRLPEDQPFKQVLGNLIQTMLAPALQNWIGWQHKASLAGPAPYPLVDTGTSELQERLIKQLVLGEALKPATDIWNDHDFSPEWLLGGAPDWVTYRNGIFADAVAGNYNEVFGSDILLPDVAGKINFAIRHFFFSNAHEQFLKGFAKASIQASSALGMLLSNWNKHELHLALYFAFLRLFEHERDALNTFTERHLGFYYRDVLRLKEKIALPGQAFVTFELAKNIEQFLLREGLKLKAGKDGNGKEMFYALTEALVANKAKVAELRCILKAPGNPALYQFSPDRPAYRNSDIHRYFAAPVANSADGLGADLTSTDKQWHLFGNKTPVTSAGQLVWNIDIPGADVGFAIASQYLFLQEGTRAVNVRVDGPNTAPLNNKTFQLRLTTEKGWHETTATFAGNTLSFILEGDAPSITPYVAKVHGASYPTSFPVLECRLPNTNTQLYQYESLKNFQVTNLRLTVSVTGKKNLALSGSTGPLDSSKPFHPFGTAPGNGAVFYVGDKEVFQKQADVTLHYRWKEADTYNKYFDPHTYGTHPATRISRLSKGQWSDQSGDIIEHASDSGDIDFQVQSQHTITPDFTPNAFFANTATAGFVRFRLVGDWGHAAYPAALTKYAVTGSGQPNPLYDPQLLELSLDYTAVTNIPLQSSAQLESQLGRLLHLHPFGFAEALPTPVGGPNLLPLMAPQYSTPVNNVGKDGGEFFMGVSGLNPPQILSLLIQVAEGSADPLLEKPENHVVWSYLQGDVWVNFEPEDVADGTLGLLQSGLIGFAMPREADTVHNLLPSGLHWIRAQVESGVDAVCKLIGVHAQGARTQWTDAGNGVQFSALPLAEGSIAKLQEPHSAVKKALQPYAGFGGRAAETTDHFFTRVSERLRHKNRGITLWDYERLVLEQFPHVHRARCLNHLQFEPSGNQFLYRELAPGHVTLIIVSNLRNRNAVNPLRPYTSLGNLKNIHDWLKMRLSCFVTLHVRNPMFEPVRAEFKVKFFPGFDETFYEKKLNDDIIRFLSPWAFDGGEELVFGGKMHKSTLVNFIEEQPYVDYLTDLKLIHLTIPPKPDQETVEPSTQCSVLVSADEHWIEVIGDDAVVGASEDCECGVPQQTGNA